ncbi:unnamed protein product [Adineta steineri]|uniref:Uncharacterized protein n=1 Tax=Adineta steineri TaxID=433720 RepID=A0A818MR05_9BILA|nr:unnamed protein product [Adineta steineri]
MCSASNVYSQPLGVWDSLRADKIAVRLKYGLHQIPVIYPPNHQCYSLIERLYYDAENWMYQLLGTPKNGKPAGRYIIHLYRIVATDFGMVPIVRSSDIEHNSLIEIILVPVEVSENHHALRESQLRVPTNCSKCTRFIAGVYKQGVRCSKCRQTYHKDCAPYLIDDCPVESNAKHASSSYIAFINPFAADSSSSSSSSSSLSGSMINLVRPELTVNNTRLPIPGKTSPNITPITIIDKGIFPACIRNAHFHGRYLFRLTTNTLSISTNLSSKNVAQTQLLPSSETETIFSLTDIEDLVLTHSMSDKDNVFEIHLRNKIIISVGKRTDSDALQMETAQFYSSIRDQRETLINATSSVPPSIPSPVEGNLPEEPSIRPRLVQKPSHFQKVPGANEAEKEDLHERYAFTGEKIGEGAFGRVLGAYRKSTKQPVAIKVIEKNGSCEDIQRINEEIVYLSKFSHINILKLEAYYERDDAVYVVTERLETDLCKYIMESKDHYLDETTSKMIIFQVIVALKYLHDKDCGHLDVKCENILLSLLKPVPAANKPLQNGIDYNQDFPLVKLADFGYSRIIGEHSFRKTRVGTKVYNAPEIYNSMNGYNRLADVWSAGVVLYAALSGSLPFDEQYYAHIKEIVDDKNRLFSDARWAYVSDLAKDLLTDKLLVMQIESRPKPNGNQKIRAKPSLVLFDDWFTDFELYRNLREIEKRARYLMSTKQQEITPAVNWLTAQREDPVWKEYELNY